MAWRHAPAGAEAKKKQKKLNEKLLDNFDPCVKGDEEPSTIGILLDHQLIQIIKWSYNELLLDQYLSTIRLLRHLKSMVTIETDQLTVDKVSE